MLKTIALIWYALLSLIAFAAMARDKAAATRGWRRTPESTLLWLAAAGGFVGVLSGMYALRHKSRKLSFRVLPWVSAIVHTVAWILMLRG